MTRHENQFPTVVVTGASGFIGRATVSELVRRRVSVVAASRNAQLPLAGAEMTTVASYDALCAPEGSILIHLAGEADIARANAFGEAHVAAERLVMARLCKCGAKRLVYASSGQVYGDGDPRPRRPDDVLPPGPPYVEAKKAAERIALDADGVSVRLANVYGPGMSARSLVANILRQIPGHGPLTIHDSRPQRDLLWIDDAARGFVDIALGDAKGAFNLGTGRTIAAGEVARLALDVAGETARPVLTTHDDGPGSAISLDISDTIRAFGWRPLVSLKEGLHRLLGRRK